MYYPSFRDNNTIASAFDSFCVSVNHQSIHIPYKYRSFDVTRPKWRTGSKSVYILVDSLNGLQCMFWVCLLLYVGIIATVVAAIVIGVVLVLTCTCTCTPVGAIIVFVVWKKFRNNKRSSMYTHTCTLCNFTRCVTCISGTLCGCVMVSLHVIYKTVCLYLYLYAMYCYVCWTNFSL